MATQAEKLRLYIAWRRGEADYDNEDGPSHIEITEMLQGVADRLEGLEREAMEYQFNRNSDF